jgi:hypothetical protein
LVIGEIDLLLDEARDAEAPFRYIDPGNAREMEDREPLDKVLARRDSILPKGIGASYHTVFTRPVCHHSTVSILAWHGLSSSYFETGEIAPPASMSRRVLPGLSRRLHCLDSN